MFIGILFQSLVFAIYTSGIHGQLAVVQDQIAVSGGSVKLSCSSTSSPVEWSENGVQQTICSGSTCSQTSVGTRTFTSSVSGGTTTVEVDIASLDRSLDEDTWSCAAGGLTSTIELKVYTTASGVLFSQSDAGSTCTSTTTYTCITNNCVYPTDDATFSFTWLYNDGTSDVTLDSSSGVTITSSLNSTGCSGDEKKIQSVLSDIHNIAAIATNSLTFKCNFQQTQMGLTSLAAQSAAASNGCTIETTTPSTPGSGFESWYIAIIIICIYFAGGWVCVLLVVLFKKDQYPWEKKGTCIESKPAWIVIGVICGYSWLYVFCFSCCLCCFAAVQGDNNDADGSPKKGKENPRTSDKNPLPDIGNKYDNKKPLGDIENAGQLEGTPPRGHNLPPLPAVKKDNLSPSEIDVEDEEHAGSKKSKKKKKKKKPRSNQVSDEEEAEKTQQN